MAFTQADLDAIEAAIAQGVEEVKYADRTVKYRSLSEMKEIRDDIAADLSTTPRIRQYRVNSSKGFAC